MEQVIGGGTRIADRTWHLGSELKKDTDAIKTKMGGDL